MPELLESIAEILDLTEAGLAAIFLVFVRVGAIMALLPAFGEQTIPARVRIALTLAFTLVVWPMLADDVTAVDPARSFVMLIIGEAVAGLLVGIAIRLMVFALQFAGAVAAQSTALAQIFGAGVAPDPMPAIGNILTLAGLALAVAANLHVKAALSMAGTYDILAIGAPLPASDIAMWGVARCAEAFALGFSLAAPFVIAAFAYNLALGAINRAMPQLMVAFIGAPALTAGGMLLLMLAAPVILNFWHARLDATLANPLSFPR